MSEFVKSLKRLYTQDKITIKKLEELKEKGSITEEEFKYISE